MKTLPLILVCLASGAVGATATHFLNPAQKPAGTSESVADLRDAIASLRSDMQSRDETIRTLSASLDRMESEASLVGFMPERTQVPKSSDEPRGDAIPAAVGSQRIQIGDTVIPQAQFENWVRQASDNIREQERLQREAERKIREGERTEERIAQLTTELGLDVRQQSEFRRFFEEQNTKRTEMMDQMRNGGAGGDRQAMRETFQKLRDEANADLQTFLSGDQYERYQASNQDFGGFGGGPGGGRRGGGGGGGGQRGGGGN